MKILKTGYTRPQARLAEAVLINAYTTKILENKRREISPAKASEWDEVLRSVWNLPDLTTDFLLQ